MKLEVRRPDVVRGNDAERAYDECNEGMHDDAARVCQPRCDPLLVDMRMDNVHGGAGRSDAAVRELFGPGEF